jgi:hypothetical protein
MTTTTDYQQQGIDFLKATQTVMNVKFLRNGKHFDDDKENRDIYEIELFRNDRSYKFEFGQSINDSGKNRKKPTAYDVFSCLPKTDPGTFEDFCSEYGYDTDSRKAEKVYTAVKDEYLQLSRLYSEKELEQMSEIQ